MTKFHLRHIIAFALLAFLTGCEAVRAPTHSPRTSLVVIDRSASIDAADRELYAQSLRTIAGEFVPGDRVIVTDASDATRSQFRALIDLEVRSSNIRAQREKAVQDARSLLTGQVEALLPAQGTAGARSSHILDAIMGGAEVFSERRAGDRIVLLSDGVEEGSAVNLSHVTNTTGVTKAIDQARKAGLIPSLRDVKLIVIGAGGRNPTSVQDFWTAYVAAAGMSLESYGRLAYRPASASAGRD